MLAAGLEKGHFVVLSTTDLTVLEHRNDRLEWIQQIKFSPDDRFLAVGSRENTIDIYDAKQHPFRRLAVCCGHSRLAITI